MLSKIHNSISSNCRVTVESVMSMLQCICGIIIGTVISVMLNFIKVNMSYIVLGLFIIVYGSLVILYRFVNKLKNTN